MTERNESLTLDESLERLLGQATPRPVPAASDAERMRSAVHAEWRSIVQRRQRRRRFSALAIAAGIVAAIGLALNTLRVPGPDGTAVATIARSVGTVYTLGEQSELRIADEQVAFRTGETILTDSDSGLALAWHTGGSLRIDANTRITFVSAGEIELHAGRVYFDSEPFAPAGAPATGSGDPLAIRTDFGLISHLGTQYMAEAGRRSLALSVREGRVSIDGRQYDATADAGQQLRLTGTGRPAVVGIRTYGAPWAWVEQTSPPADMDGRSVHDFLRWAGRETGLELRFASDAAERLAETSTLSGYVDIAPTEAIPIWLMTTDLEARIGDGLITVSLSRTRDSRK